MTRFLRISVVVVGVGFGACSGSTEKPFEFKPLPDPMTRATLVGPLCEEQQCACRTDGRDVGLPDLPGQKRYEFKVGPIANAMWVTVDNMVLYKSRERATECFYIDLPTGEHPVTVRAKGEDGFAATLSISELGKQGSYDTFDFDCGGPGPCQLDSLQEWQASLAKYKRNIHDPCGATKIRQIAWHSGDTPDKIHPSELALNLIVHVYDFEPKHPSGHAECADKF